MKKLAIVPLMCLLVVSCDGNGNGDNGPTAPSQTFQGTFTLESATATVEGSPQTVTPPLATGTAIIMPDNTYTRTLNWPAGEIFNETSSGTWSLDGSQLTVNETDGRTLTGSVSEDQNTIELSFVEDGMTIDLVFVRA